MTKEEWLIAEKRTLQGYTGCKLLIDGYYITLILVPETEYKKSVAVYVNGKIDFKHGIEDCEERRRFFQPRTRQVRKTNAQKDIYKSMSKKQQADWKKRFTYTWYRPYWSNFKSLKAHLLKNNTSIELVTETEDNVV